MRSLRPSSFWSLRPSCHCLENGNNICSVRYYLFVLVFFFALKLNDSAGNGGCHIDESKGPWAWEKPERSVKCGNYVAKYVLKIGNAFKYVLKYPCESIIRCVPKKNTKIRGDKTEIIRSLYIFPELYVLRSILQPYTFTSTWIPHIKDWPLLLSWLFGVLRKNIPWASCGQADRGVGPGKICSLAQTIQDLPIRFLDALWATLEWVVFRVVKIIQYLAGRMQSSESNRTNLSRYP